MHPAFTFAHELPFTPEDAPALLRQIPESPGLLALFGPPATSSTPSTTPAPPSQPFLTRTANLRRRAARLLQPPSPSDQPTSRRLNLRDRVARIAFSPTGSEFESLLLIYQATAALFGLGEARRRLRLHTPFFVRFAADNAHPRLYVSNRLSRRSLAHTFGPFPSRLAAERCTDAVLDLFKLRRCWEDLVVHPNHPGCAYGEMRKCLAPCNLTCTPEAYAAESHAVEQFLRTRGESLLATVAADRDRASDDMDFERAADLHRQHEKIKAAIALADPLVRPVSELRAVIVQPAAPDATPEHSTEQASLFLLDGGRLVGPQLLSTIGVRAVREQTAVGSSLFAQPLMLAAVPLPPEPASDRNPLAAPTPDSNPERTTQASPPSDLQNPASSTHTITPLGASLSPEHRAQAALATLALRAESISDPDPALLSDHLALLRRWYFRPEKQRSGELLAPNPDGSWPIRRLLNAAARAALGDPKPMQGTDREAAKTLKTKLIHAGREGVERSVPVLGPKPRPTPDPASDSAPPAFRSRRSRRPSPMASSSQPSSPADKLSPP